MLSPSSAGKIARSDSIPAGFACLKMIAAVFVELETARLAKKLKAAGRRGRGALARQQERQARRWQEGRVWRGHSGTA